VTAIPLASKSDPARSSTVSPERLINAFAEVSPEGAKAPFAVYRAPGLADFSLLSSEICRAVFSLTDGASEELIALMGQTLFSVNEDGDPTDLSGSLPGTDTPIYDRNQAGTTQVLFTHNAGMSKLEGGTVATFTDASLPSSPTFPNSVCNIAQRFVLGYDDGRVFYSAVNDDEFEALDFFTCEGDPDGLKRVFKYRNELYCFGFKTIEVRKPNAADSDNPFVRISGADIPVGLIAKHAVTELAGSLYWVDQDLIVRRMAAGYNAEAISNHGVQDALQEYLRGGNSALEIRLWGAVYGSHQFLVVWTPDFAWVFDASMNHWHERKTYTRDTWQARLHAYCFGKNIVTSDIGGNLYELSEQAFTDADDPIVMECITPPIANFPYGAKIPAIDLDVECGTAADSSASSADQEPMVMLSISKDGGKTFGAERWRSLGTRGQYRRQVRWTRNGRAGREGVVLKFAVSAAVKVALIKCDMVAERTAA
jgi:hypothetical protein